MSEKPAANMALSGVGGLAGRERVFVSDGRDKVGQKAEQVLVIKGVQGPNWKFRINGSSAYACIRYRRDEIHPLLYCSGAHQRGPSGARPRLDAAARSLIDAGAKAHQGILTTSIA